MSALNKNAEQVSAGAGVPGLEGETYVVYKLQNLWRVALPGSRHNTIYDTTLLLIHIVKQVSREELDVPGLAPKR